MSRRLSLPLAALLLLAAGPRAAAQEAAGPSYAITPRPAVLMPSMGQFTLSARTPLRADPAFAGVARTFARYIEKSTGFELPITLVRSSPGGTGAIRLVRVTGRDTLPLGAEGDTLDVTMRGVTVRAAHPAGRGTSGIVG